MVAPIFFWQFGGKFDVYISLKIIKLINIFNLAHVNSEANMSDEMKSYSFNNTLDALSILESQLKCSAW